MHLIFSTNVRKSRSGQGFYCHSFAQHIDNNVRPGCKDQSKSRELDTVAFERYFAQENN